MTDDELQWWQKGVFYQIYPRSFRDSNNDGVGDIKGIVERLDYMAWLGIDGIWLNPITESPNADWGYDVSDYLSVDPELGSMEDVDELIEEAGKRGIEILLDFVPNHTSTEHQWFRDARSSRTSAHRDWYVWADPKSDGSPPNNWLSVFGGDAWEFDNASGQYYLHNFLDSQADLNWWNEEVKDAMDDVLRFWYRRGIAGFRIDVAHGIVKDKDLRDNLPATERDDPRLQALGQVQTYSMNQPGVHDVIKRWRQVSDSFDPPRILVGETFLFDLVEVAKYYGRGDELHMAFNFPFIFAPFEAKPLRDVVELTESLLEPLAWPVWTGSNHDVLRFPTRWCRGNDRKTRLALMMLMTLRGTPFLYYGDEIGLPNTPLFVADIKDPVGKRSWTSNRGRDPARTPMHWNGETGAGFTSGNTTPWLPFGDRSRNVAVQKNDPGSILALTRALISLRKSSSDLTTGRYESIASPEGVWIFRRGESTIVALNLSERTVTLDVDGTLELSTYGRAEPGPGRLELLPWQGAVVTG
jgi:alpha-glucosidase